MKQFPASIPLSKKPYKTPCFSPTKNFVDYFDTEHCMRLATQIENLILMSYRSIALSEETKKKIIDLGTPSVLYASLHKSHFDYIAICLKLFLEGLPCPRTIAGSNLLTGFLRRFIKHFTKIDMMKWGAVPMERTTSISRDLLDICKRMETILKSDKPVLAFPEMEIMSESARKSIKTGRAYSGKIRKFGSALFRPAINASKEGKKVYVVPMSVSYDFVAEDRYFDRLAQADKMKRTGNALASFAGKLYYGYLESHFFYNIYHLGRGNIYIDMGEPILVEPNASKKELALRAQKEAARCCRITMPALVSYAISKGATQKNELKRFLERYVALLNGRNINVSLPEEPEGSIDETLRDLVKRKVISNHNEISVKNQGMINYYANTIAHHFEGSG